MASVFHELGTISVDLRSEKVTTRNKAAERLETLLTTCKREVLAALHSDGDDTQYISWTDLFNSSIDAIVKHASKVEQSLDSKSLQTLRNKNYLYSGLVTKIIDLNLENGNQLLSMGTIFSAFSEGLSQGTIIKHFGLQFLSLLDRGLYKSDEYVRSLKINEYRRILVILFEMNVCNDDLLHFGIVRSITRTIELASQRVQIAADLICYLPEVLVYARKANDDRRKADVVKLLHLFMQKVAVDYRHSICKELQTLLPVVIDYYSVHMKRETKVIFFQLVAEALHTIYPYINRGDCNTLHIELDDKWPKVLKKLHVIVNNEIRDRNLSLQRFSGQADEHFIKMSSLIVYLIHWHLGGANSEAPDSESEPRSKMPKTSDKLELLIELVQPPGGSAINEMWFSIFAEVISSIEGILNPSNYSQALQCSLRVFQMSANANVLRNARICFFCFLAYERTRDSTQKYDDSAWQELLSNLLGESNSNSDLGERQLILQALIAAGKVNADNCAAILQSFVSSASKRRSDCLNTVRQILIHSNRSGFDKTSAIVERVLLWCIEESSKVDGKSLVLNLTPVSAALVADTCALAVINFLQDEPLTEHCHQEIKQNGHNLQLLLYKYHRRFISVEQHGSEPASRGDRMQGKTCLFQSQYEALMRAVNYETSKEVTCQDILRDLKALQKLTILMKSLLGYKVFDEHNFTQCPLVKRIGLFLSHLEFQLKSNKPQDMQEGDVSEVLQLLNEIFASFVGDGVLLKYLETQPLDEIISFLHACIQFSGQQGNGDFASWSQQCCVILSMLCSSSSHCSEAFEILQGHQFKLKTDIDTILNIAEILSTQKNATEDIAGWLVDVLRLILKHSHTNVEVVERVIDHLPGLFEYVHSFAGPKADMFMVLISLLKICYKKSYTPRMTAAIITNIRRIMRCCRDDCGSEHYTNIALSVVKFLAFASLDIQFATVNTLIALLDRGWLGVRQQEVYFEFCRQIYGQIDWRSLPTTTTDETQNSNSVTVQLLVGIFLYATYFKESALEELVGFCASRKLTEVDFEEFQSIGLQLNTSLTHLTKPYVNDAVHMWASKGYPLLRFPYFLFSPKKRNFLQENLPLLSLCSLLYYDNTETLQKLDKLEDADGLLKMAQPLARAVLLPMWAECRETSDIADYAMLTEKLLRNLESCDVDMAPTSGKGKKPEPNWECVYYCLNALNDPEHFRQTFHTAVFPSPAKWFHISYDSFIGSIRTYLKSSSKNVLEPLLRTQPLSVVYLLGSLKEDCLDGAFTEAKLKSFHRYCVAAELVLQSLAQVKDSSATYFMQDILFFLLQYLSAERDCDIQKVVLVFLQALCQRHVGANSKFNEILCAHLQQLAKCLVDIAEASSSDAELSDSAIGILNSIVEQHKDAVQEQFLLINEFPAKPQYLQLRELQQSLKESQTDENYNCLKSFLDTRNPSIEDLKAARKHISRNKRDLQQNVEINALISHLLELVRNGEHSNEAYHNEAARLLGEIGSMKIPNVYYYFHSGDIEEEKRDLNDETPKHQFISAMLATFGKMLNSFNVKTYRKAYAVVESVVNSKHCRKVTTDAYQTVFANDSIVSCIDSPSMKSINWKSAMQLSVSVCRSYSEWACAFMGRVFASSSWSTFEELSAVDAEFADAVMEPFIKLLIADGTKHLDQLWHLLDYFFGECARVLSANDATETNAVFKDKKVIGKLLSITECLRLRNNMTLPIHLLNVVKACNYCQAYFMSIMYLELWYLHEKSLAPDATQYELIRKEHFQETATKAYKSIGCCAAISGFLDPLQSRMDYLNLENHWPDILIESDANEINRSVLKRNGMLLLAESGSSPSSDTDYEICWRLCQWDKSVEGHALVNTLNDMEHEFEKHHYNALKCLYNREENNSRAAVVNARNCILTILKEISLECLQSVYKYLTWLQLLQHIEDFMEIQFGSGANISEIFEKWRTDCDLEYGSFECKEQVLSHQITLFGLAGVRANRKIKEFHKENPMEARMLQCIRECRKAGQINLAKRNVAMLKKMPLSNQQMKINVLLEDAEICMLTGKSPITKAILHHVLSNKEYAYCLQRITAFRMQGEYLMETNSEHFEAVQKSYFHASLELLNKFEASKEVILAKCPDIFDLDTFEVFRRNHIKATHRIIARYADREYTQLNDYANSEEFQMKCRIIEVNRRAAESVGKQVADREKNVCAMFMKKNANLDEKEVKSVEEHRTANLCVALENYMRYCTLDAALSNAEIFRIIALWFTNKQNDQVMSKIEEHIASVPSYKFIPALSQMTARLNSNNGKFLAVLKNVLIRCAQDHPYHTLWQLYPLVYAFKDGDGDKKNDRVAIAKEIIAKAKTKQNAECIKQMDVLVPALIEYSNQSAADPKAKVMPLSDKLRRLKNLDAIQCPTLHLEVAVDLRYSITTIVKWSEKASLVGGINAPKKLVCLTSDGKTRPQLLKGKDDLRQDAVMQQVFTMINDLLRGDSESSAAGNLCLRTYKVVPLSMRSGILEWCENTVPIGAYLMEAHKKYRPNEYTVSKCRQLSMQHLKSSFEARHEIYTKICENVKPIFHYFLFEKFSAPGVWFERRLAYTNSVATTSMVGYILGLGDRHTQNILIDEHSAEVIHIDFGIAFEQGKIMPTPETVPFRLTRDMVAPMGISSTNGTFKKSCEATMRILRRNQSIITTILEVLLYDPLYIWKAVPQEDRSEKNLTAQRALLCVQNKLEGKQSRITGIANVEVQVQRLINEATSSRNLCMLYPGWDPYL